MQKDTDHIITLLTILFSRTPIFSIIGNDWCLPSSIYTSHSQDLSPPWDATYCYLHTFSSIFQDASPLKFLSEPTGLHTYVEIVSCASYLCRPSTFTITNILRNLCKSQDSSLNDIFHSHLVILFSFKNFTALTYIHLNKGTLFWWVEPLICLDIVWWWVQRRFKV